MRAQTWRMFGLGLLIVAVAAVTFGVHRDNGRLRGRLAGLRGQRDRAVRLRADNQRMQELLARLQTDAAGAEQVLNAEVERARAEVATLERNAIAQYQRTQARSSAETQAMAINRDPAFGLTRPEYCRNVGQATPGASFQTLVWAALKGDDPALAQLMTLTPSARAKAESLIAGLSAEARAQWTPEKLAALFFSGLLTEMSAVQEIEETFVESQSAAMKVRLIRGGREATVPLQWQRGPAGWQVVFDDRALVAMQKKLEQAGGAPAKN